MCGRTTMLYTWNEIRDFYRLDEVPVEVLTPNYNAAPTQRLPVVRSLAPGHRSGSLLTWGLVPGWVKDVAAMKIKPINARGEEAASKPMFRSAWKSRRCVVSASGYYEWQKLPGGGKRPTYLHRADGEPLSFAGLWESNGDLETFTIVTTAATNKGLAEIHDRTPVILEPEEIAAWLDPRTTPAEVQALADPVADGVLAWHEVTARVGNVRNNDAKLIERVA